jgi:hypothetical protein
MKNTQEQPQVLQSFSLEYEAVKTVDISQEVRS